MEKLVLWWITTDQLSKGGERLMGPFVSRELAIDARVVLEKQTAPKTYWVDSEIRRLPEALPNHNGLEVQEG